MLGDPQKIVVSPETYKEYYLAGKLKNRKVLKSLVEEKPKPEPEVKPVEQTFTRVNESSQLLNIEPTKIRS